MQVIEIYLEPGEGEKGSEILKGLGIDDFNLIKSETNDLIKIRHPLDQTDKIISSFESEFKFKPEDHRGIIISTPDVILPKEAEKEKKFHEKSAWQVMIDDGEKNSYLSSRYLALFFFAAVVATLGLITDNVAVVVGAMIIAPAFGPISSIATGIVSGRRDMFINGIKTEIIGIILAVATAALLGFLLPGVEMNESLRLRMYPTLFDLFVALAAGAAGGYVLVSGKRSTVVGVMVAAALIPVMAAIGIGFVFLNPLLVLGAFILLMVNVVSIVLAMVIVFWFAGPKEKALEYEQVKEKEDVKKMIEGIRQTRDYKVRKLTVKRMVNVFIVLIIVLIIPLVWMTNEAMITKSPEKEINNVFLESPYPSIKLGGIAIEGNNVRVTVYDLGGTSEDILRDLYTKIENRIDPRYSLEFNILKATRTSY